MAFYPSYNSYPPLGRLTSLDKLSSEIAFSFFIEGSEARPNSRFEVLLCYSTSSNPKHHSQWPSLPLKRSNILPSVITASNEVPHRAVYTGSLSLDNLGFNKDERGSQHLRFSYRHRANADGPWRSLQTYGGVETGEILVANQRDTALETVLELRNGWTVESLPISTPSAAPVYQLASTEPIIHRDTDEQGLSSKSVGRVKGQVRMFAVIRIKPYWIGATQGRNHLTLEEDALLCCFLTESGSTIALLAFNSHNDVYSVFRSGQEDDLLIAARNDSNEHIPYQLLASVSGSYKDAIAAVMTGARGLVNENPKIKQLAEVTQANQSTESVSFFDGLTFCTWNALGQNLTRHKLLDGLDKLGDDNIKPATLLIDDNWQTLGPTSHDPTFERPFFRGFADFQANQDVAPGGLKSLITSIRKSHRHLKTIGVWHALFGYWGGIASPSPLVSKYKTRQVSAKLMENIPATVTIIDPSDVHRFYDDFYTFLSSCGIDFVKTDVQHMLDMLSSPQDRLDVVPAYQSAWTTAYIKHFQGRAISCMSQIPETTLYSLLQSYTPKILIRNSDDFFPDIPASHVWHVWVNAHNSLLTSHLNGIPDWDMFQTSHPFSRYHAAARCISGGNVTITDVPGEHDKKLLDEMTATSPTGSIVALRPSLATTMTPWDRYADGKPLLIGTVCRETGQRVAILGVFNIAEGERHALLSLRDFPEIEAQKVIVGSHDSGKIFGPFDNHNGEPKVNELLQVRLAVRGCDILTAYPVHEIKSGVNLAVLGLLGKMTGAAAVTSYSIESVQDKLKLTLKMKALGVLGLWIEEDGEHEANVERVTIEGDHLDMSRYAEARAVRKNVAVVNLNLLALWEEENFESWRTITGGEDREIEVEVIMV